MGWVACQARAIEIELNGSGSTNEMQYSITERTLTCRHFVLSLPESLVPEYLYHKHRGLKRLRTLKPCKRNYLFEGSINGKW